MEVKYKCGLGDYQEAFVTPEAKPLGRKMLVAVLGGVMVILGILVLTVLGLSQSAAAITIMALWILLLSVCRFVVRPLWIGRDFRKHPNFSREQRLVIDEEGVHYESEVGQSDKEWRAYSRYRETTNLFILHLGPRLIEVVPKRAFAGPQVDEFRQLLQQKLPCK